MKKIGAIASVEVFGALRDIAPDFDLDVQHLGLHVADLSPALCVGLSGVIVELDGQPFGAGETEILESLALPIAGLPVSDQIQPDEANGVVTTILWGPSDVAAWVATLDGSEPLGALGQVGQIVVVWGPSGAPGRTTVAISVASLVAKAGHKVVLIDGDTESPSIAPLLGLTAESSGLLTSCRIARSAPVNVEDVLARSVTYTGTQLSCVVLTGLVGKANYSDVDSLAFGRVLDSLTHAGYHVVIDVGAALAHEPGDAIGGVRRNGVAITSLERADSVLVVLRPHLVSALRLIREWGRVQELAPRAKTRVLINGVSPHHQPALLETQHTLWEFTGVTDTTVLVAADDVVQRATTNTCTVAEIGPKNNLALALAPLVKEFFPPPKPEVVLRKEPARRQRGMASLFARVPGKQAKGLL